MEKYEIYTDGGFKKRGKKCIGGYGIIIIHDDIILQIKKKFKNTDNNVMELIAAVDALKSITSPSEITLYSDSLYVIETIQLNKIEKWMENDWKQINRNRNVQNKELWQELYDLLKFHKVTPVKVKGHCNCKMNILCDKLATEAMNEIN